MPFSFATNFFMTLGLIGILLFIPGLVYFIWFPVTEDIGNKIIGTWLLTTIGSLVFGKISMHLDGY